MKNNKKTTTTKKIFLFLIFQEWMQMKIKVEKMNHKKLTTLTTDIKGGIGNLQASWLSFCYASEKYYVERSLLIRSDETKIILDSAQEKMKVLFFHTFEKKISPIQPQGGFFLSTSRKRFWKNFLVSSFLILFLLFSLFCLITTNN